MVERRLAALDRAEDAAVFNTGMAAISARDAGDLQPGDAVLHGRPVYGGTDGLLTGLMAGFGVGASASPTGSTATPCCRRRARPRRPGRWR